ncbi:MAG: EAL domain-containing protein [Lachnospiraceae bacterium]|nr:EAL domain-containing protein [Lachnospiraceae bacterium]
MMNKYTYDKETLALIESSCIPCAVYQFVDKRVVTLALSEGFCELFGLERQEAYKLMDNDMYRDAHPDDVARIADAAYQFAVNGGQYEVVYRSKPPRNSEYTVLHAFGRHVYTRTGERLAVVWYVNEGPYTDIADGAENYVLGSMMQKLHSESLIRENYYDVLTGLPNMLYFMELAQEGRKKIQEQGGIPAILFFDLSGMKAFNRRYGFAEGDVLLRAFSKLLVQYFSNENCGRFASDHFTVYTDSVDLEKRLLSIFRETEKLNSGKTLPIRVGIYQDRFENVSISTACDRAKTACDLERITYFSTYVYYDEKLRDTASKKHYVLDNLDTALKEKWIRVFYQPIIRTVTGKVCDEEALARWIDPVRGIITPGEFIPILEDARLLYKIDLYVVEQVLDDIHRKEAAGLSVVPVSVNLSRNDFAACDMVDEISRRVDEAGVARNLINIEITESVIGLDYDFMKDQVRRFHEAGFHVWMDDFGSGYSSLDVLQKFDFDLIKFDMAFMKDFHRSEKNHVILTQLMQMASKIGVDTVAEGVETEEHIRFLTEIGCDKIQGFYYSKPVPLEVAIDKYQHGTGVYLENMMESMYYATISTTNLSDPMIDSDTGSMLYQYFNSVPMGIIEIRGNEFCLLRANRTYCDLLIDTFGMDMPRDIKNVANIRFVPDSAFAEALLACDADGNWSSFDKQKAVSNKLIAFMRQIACNPVNGYRAILIIVLNMLK